MAAFSNFVSTELKNLLFLPKDNLVATVLKLLLKLLAAVYPSKLADLVTEYARISPIIGVTPPMERRRDVPAARDEVPVVKLLVYDGIFYFLNLYF